MKGCTVFCKGEGDSRVSRLPMWAYMRQATAAPPHAIPLASHMGLSNFEVHENHLGISKMQSR